MSSSSWHVIRSSGPPDRGAGPTRTGEPAGPADGGAAVAASAGMAASGSAVLRGRGRGSTHSPARPATATSPLAGIVPSELDPAELAEEVRRVEAEARQRGYDVGRARAEAELQAAVAGAGAMAARIHETAPERTSEVAHAIAELALCVARRIVQREVHVEPSVLCGALEAAVSTINGSPEAHVLLNPAAVDPVRQAWEALHGRAHLGKRWVFEGDPNLPPGGCTVRFEHGFVEAGLEAQLEEIGIALDRAIPNLARTTIEDDLA